MSLSRSFSGGTASARATTATTGGRRRLLVATAATRTAATAATVNRAAGGATCIAVTHEVHAQVGEVAQVTREGVASTGAGDDDATVTQSLEHLVDHGPLLNIVGNGDSADHVHCEGGQRAQGLFVAFGQVNDLGGCCQAQDGQYAHEHHGHCIFGQQYSHADGGGFSNTFDGCREFFGVDIAGNIQHVVGVHGDGAGAQRLGECFVFGVDRNHVAEFVAAHNGGGLDEGEVLAFTVHEEGVDFFAVEAFTCGGALD